MVEHHRDDEFHPPASDDPYWAETCWFTFTVPERRLSGQLYPFFQPNLGVVSAGAYLWDPSGSSPADALYARQFWHLPIPDRPLSDLTLANGISYRCVEPLRRYEISYVDPDEPGPTSGAHFRLSFTALAPPHYLGDSHLDQPGRFVGTVTLDGAEIAVDSFGFRDRSWGPRSQFGAGIHGTPAEAGGYSYATASAEHAFHAVTMDFGDGPVGIHGYVARDGEWSALATGTRTVTSRDPATGHPRTVVLRLADALGRRVEAEGTCLNGLGFFLNPNLYTVNCLTQWSFDGVTAFGEDHDNWSASGIRRFLRGRKGPTLRGGVTAG